MENANSQSLGTHTTLVFFPSHIFSLLHSNRLTNVPWKFTLDVGSRGSKRKVAEYDAETVCTCFHPELLLTVYRCNPSVWGKWKHYSKYNDLAILPGICCSSTLSLHFSFRAASASFLFPDYSSKPHLTASPPKCTHTSSTNSSPSAPPPSYKQLIFCSTTALMDALRLEASQPRDIHLLECHTPARQKIFVMCTPIFLQ